MQYKNFGRRAGWRVSEAALGTGNFGTGWGHGAERDEARSIFDGYLEAGGNFIDTADGYQGGQAEVMLADFIAPERECLVLPPNSHLAPWATAGRIAGGTPELLLRPN